MNLYDYLDNYGMYTFDEKEINEIDKVIFSFISYVDFRGIVKHNKITIKEAGRMHLGLHKIDAVNIIAVKEANKLLRHLKDTKRFKDCLLYNYIYEGTEKLQFGAICKYINRLFTFSKKELIVGGHSKGGNLALVASMHANIFVRSQIKEIDNVDGPGLLAQEFYSEEFKRILPKYKHIIPDNSFVGMLLNNTNETVIKTTTKGPITHSIAYWKVKDDKFVLNDLSPYSIELRKDILDWLSTTHKNDIRKLAKNFQNIFDAAEIDSLIDIKNKRRKIFELIEESRTMDREAKIVLIGFIKMVIKSFGDTYIDEIKNKVRNYIE